MNSDEKEKKRRKKEKGGGGGERKNMQCFEVKMLKRIYSISCKLNLKIDDTHIDSTSKTKTDVIFNCKEWQIKIHVVRH